jgi:hypothetical protein
LDRFGHLLGAPRSTIHDWYHGSVAKPINHFLCALERLSEKQRADMFRNLCRQCPRVEHLRLAHDQEAVKLLKELLANPVGLTLVPGPSDPLRTFLITALGNSAAQLIPVKTVCGLDIHKPDLFVPVHGVLYFWEPDDTAQVRQLLPDMWQVMKNAPTDLILLNRVWTIMPEIREEIIACARSRHVIMADQFEAGVTIREGGTRIYPQHRPSHLRSEPTNSGGCCEEPLNGPKLSFNDDNLVCSLPFERCSCRNEVKSNRRACAICSLVAYCPFTAVAGVRLPLEHFHKSCSVTGV